MAKKVSARFDAKLVKNLNKGGAWLGSITTYDEGIVEPNHVQFEAFSNASAGKRWIKEQVIALTPKKSCKMIAGDIKDAKDKPALFIGSVGYKREI